MFHDPYTGETYAPIQHLPGANASFEVYNSPLSEYAALGFEYGYSVAAPDALVLWEAQFGDFVNGAQIVIDQFLVAGRSKWGQTSRLTLLLPHGYEGNGPEHSSARLERFLQQGAQDNIRIANCTTAAQFFHLLRRQALDATARPLVVMTPKGLLRLRAGVLDARGALASGSFQPVIPDHDRRRRTCAGSSSAAARSTTTSSATARAPGATGVAVARLEQLYPFPVDAVAALVACLPRPRGDRLGAGGAAEHGGVALDPPPARRRRPLELRRARASPTSGGSWRASPSEGYPTAHQLEQDRIVRVALGVSSAARARVSASCGPARPARSADRGYLRAVRRAAAAATRGPCVRAASSSRRRCSGGSLRHRL